MVKDGELGLTGTQVPSRPVPAGKPALRGQDLYRQAEKAREQCRVLLEEAKRIRHELEQAVAPVYREKLLERSSCARLLARLETMPVIEQAKGIVMAQTHCEPAEAFDILRRASQRSNVPVRDIAALIVARVYEPAPQARPEQRHDQATRPEPGGLPWAS
jgi:hypothetical protein